MAQPQRVSVPLIGPSSKARFEDQQSGETINLYPETNDPDAKAVIALHAVPGFFRVADLTTHIIGNPSNRGYHIMGGRFFAVIAEKICEIVVPADLTAFTAPLILATLSTFTGRVGLSDNNGKLVIGDGTGFYVLDLDTHALTPVLSVEGDAIRGTISCWKDGYTLYFERDSSRYFYSTLNDPLTVDDLNFLSAEGSPDFTIAALNLNGEVLIAGTDSMEGHINTGGADNAFERRAGALQPIGCAARWSLVACDNACAMVSRNANGQGQVVRISSAGAAPLVISTPAVEHDLAKVLFSTLDRADLTEQITAFSYDESGHRFYVLNLPAVGATVNSPAQSSRTWVYDFVTGLWHRRGYTNPATGLFERILADHHVLWRGRHYVGPYNVAHILEMSHDYYRDNTLPLIKWRETAGPMSFQGRRWSLNRLEIQGNTGHGRDGGVQGSDPQVMVQFCWDGRWSDPVPRGWGKIGERNARAVWDRCGSGYELVIRVVCSEPISFALTAGLADVTLGR